MKKKGSALIYTLAVIIILTAFVMALLVIAVSNRTTTAYLEKSNKLRYAAESGIDIAMEKLKENIEDGGDIGEKVKFNIDFTDPLVDNILFDDDIYLNVNASETTIFDSKLGKDIPCIHLSSTATKNGKKKIVNAYLDERRVGINNVFFDEIFSKPYIVKEIEKESNNNMYPILKSQLDEDTLKEHANVLSFDYPDFTIDDLDYDFYSKGIEDAENDNIIDDKIKKDNKLYVLLCDSNKIGEDASNINNITAYLAGYVSEITGLSDFPLDETSPYPGNLQGYTSSVHGPYDKDNYDKIFDTKSLDDNYIKSWLYRNVLFTNYMKIVVVDGDAKIDNLYFPLENYIIYCTGDLDINYNLNNNIKLYNSSIIANNIKVNGIEITDYEDEDKKLSLLGIEDNKNKKEILKYILNLNDDSYMNLFDKEDENQNRLTPKFPSDAWVNLLSNERVNISSCFNEIFEDYWEGYKFRIIKWKEGSK